MELGKAEIKETQGDTPELGFDPDQLISGNEVGENEEPEGADTPEVMDVSEVDVNPETVLHDPEQLAAPVEGLEQTQQGFEQLDNGNTLFDHPYETGATLNSNQGKAVPGFVGTCGLVSAENVCKLAGKDISEADVVGIARENKDCKHHFWWPAEANGATNAYTICDVLSHLGIGASIDASCSIAKMADSVESGHGVIALVDVGEFWPDVGQDGGHAVTVTSVERNPDGSIAALYVCDSGRKGEQPCRRAEPDLFNESLYCAVVTDDIVR
ncbi:MAG: C39 family peptidase [Coriobacteriia bacterium]|nr:C39 family peptidase [Coriobacteriia bacterium]